MGFDMQKMMKQAQKMQQQMQDIQEELGGVEVTGSAGGGAVKITCNGKQEFKKVEISQDALSEDKESLEEMVLMALQDATRKVSEMAEQKMSSLTSGLNIPGLNFPGF
jgi:DNA-binding YbaB/EbfC family protein